jgi:hypothetical protein
VSATEIDIVFSGTAEPGWHIYSTNLPEDGPNSAMFGTDLIKGAEVMGELKPGPGAKTEFDKMFEMNITFFEDKCTFTQRVKLTSKDYQVKGYLNYSACNDQNCLPPTNVEFDLKGKDGPKGAAAPAQETKKADPCEAKVKAFEQFVDEFKAAQKNKANGAKELKAFADMLKQAPEQEAAVKECVENADFKTRIQNAIMMCKQIRSQK